MNPDEIKVVDKPAVVNVGTIGHIDHGRVLLSTSLGPALARLLARQPAVDILERNDYLAAKYNPTRGKATAKEVRKAKMARLQREQFLGK